MKIACPFNLMFSLLMAALAAPAWSNNGWQFTSGLDYSSGKFGSLQATEVWYVPFIARYNADAWQFKLSVPYVSMRAPTGGNIIGYDDNGTPIRDGAGVRATESGLGDVIASATFSLMEHQNLLLDMTTKVKFGTASVTKGLGTGEQDYSLGFDAYFPMGRATPFVSVGHKWTGDPAAQNLNNTKQFGLGLAYKFSDVWSGGGLWDWRSAASSQGKAQRDLTFYAVYKPGVDWKLQGYVSKGFSDASADYGLGVMATMNY